MGTFRASDKECFATGRWFFPGFFTLTIVTSSIHFVVENRVILFNSNRDILLFDRILEQYDYYIS
jgi:hypothetical protein